LAVALMDLIRRHANVTVLLTVLFLQVVGLAVQVKRPAKQGPTRLIRLWSLGLITPAERAVVHTQNALVYLWRNYCYLRDVRRENDRLQEENLRLRLEAVRLAQDANQARRLQALMRFKETFVSETVPAQVIGSSGSENSRLIYIDKGAHDGLKSDMAVLSPAGIIGKIVGVGANYAQVLEINDASSGVGAMLEHSRLQGILKGTPAGETMLHYVMADEKVELGEMVVTSGGDRVFPKGLPIGRVVQVNPGPDTFLNIRVKPAAQLDRVEEVLVITKLDEQEPEFSAEAPMRAADILAQRLPGVPVRPPAAGPSVTPASGSTAATSSGPAPGPAAGASPSPGAASPAPRTRVNGATTAAGAGGTTPQTGLPKSVPQGSPPTSGSRPEVPGAGTSAPPPAAGPKSTPRSAGAAASPPGGAKKENPR
jgi:rod shape-determining protein MreC